MMMGVFDIHDMVIISVMCCCKLEMKESSVYSLQIVFVCQTMMDQNNEQCSTSQ